MQIDAWPAEGFGQFAGEASIRLAPELNPPSTETTVWYTRELVRHPLPFAALTCVVPEQEPVAEANGLSEASAFATACRAPWRAASATVVVTQSTRKRSIVSARMKKSTGKMSANSTMACPRPPSF